MLATHFICAESAFRNSYLKQQATVEQYILDAF